MFTNMRFKIAEFFMRKMDKEFNKPVNIQNINRGLRYFRLAWRICPAVKADNEILSRMKDIAEEFNKSIT